MYIISELQTHSMILEAYNFLSKVQIDSTMEALAMIFILSLRK